MLDCTDYFLRIKDRQDALDDARNNAAEQECSTLWNDCRSDRKKAIAMMEEAVGYINNAETVKLAAAVVAGDKSAAFNALQAMFQRAIEREADANVESREWSDAS